MVLSEYLYFGEFTNSSSLFLVGHATAFSLYRFKKQIFKPLVYVQFSNSNNNNCQALTGGKDAYFVLENWFGVADGVGQWSLAGDYSKSH